MRRRQIMTNIALRFVLPDMEISNDFLGKQIYWAWRNEYHHFSFLLVEKRE